MAFATSLVYIFTPRFILNLRTAADPHVDDQGLSLSYGSLSSAHFASAIVDNLGQLLDYNPLIDRDEDDEDEEEQLHVRSVDEIDAQRACTG